MAYLLKNKGKYHYLSSVPSHPFKVGISCMGIVEPWVQINGHLQSLHNFRQKFGWNCSFCLKAPHIWPHHQQTHKTGHTTMYGFIMMNYVIHVKTLCHTEKQGLVTLDFQKKFQTPTKTRWTWVQFQKGQPTPCKAMLCFPRSPLG